MDNFTKQIKELKSKYAIYADDYYLNATLVFRLIFDQQIFARHYECLNEFNRLASGIYSDAYIEKQLRSKKDKTKFARNLLHTRALGCLAIVDAIDKLEFFKSSMTEQQIKGYNNLLKVRGKLLNLAKESFKRSNEISKEFNYPPILFDIEMNYTKK